MPSTLMRNDTSQVERIGMVRLDHQQLPIAGVSVIQPSGLVVFDTRCHQIGGGSRNDGRRRPRAGIAWLSRRTRGSFALCRPAALFAIYRVAFAGDGPL